MPERFCTVNDCEKIHFGRGWCRMHYGRARNNGWTLDGWRPPIHKRWARTDAKPCKDCGEVLPLAEFAPMRAGFLGRNSRCRPCQNVYQNQRNAQPHVRARRRAYTSQPHIISAQRAAWVRRTYGETGLSIEKRRLAGEPCDVCGRVTPGMALDHCHDTMRPRGLLCRDCNWALGKVRDDPAVLRALADYVERTTPER